jgi:hypothetical protein
MDVLSANKQSTMVAATVFGSERKETYGKHNEALCHGISGLFQVFGVTKHHRGHGNSDYGCNAEGTESNEDGWRQPLSSGRSFVAMAFGI